jgi:hypothetical protein
MIFSVGAIRYRLGPGDSLCFVAEEDHDLEPASRKVQHLAVFTRRAGASAQKGRKKQ